MKRSNLLLSLFLLTISAQTLGRCNFCVSPRDTKIYYYFKQFDYFNYELNRMETRLDRTRAYLQQQANFKAELLAFKQKQLDNHNQVQFKLAQYRLKVWCENSHCDICKLMRKVRRVQDQISYEWEVRLQLDQKVVWIDQVLAHDSCPDAIQLREFADRLKHKFARLEAIYQELKLLAQDTCQL